jgi:hypothetical protein
MTHHIEFQQIQWHNDHDKYSPINGTGFLAFIHYQETLEWRNRRFSAANANFYMFVVSALALLKAAEAATTNS